MNLGPFLTPKGTLVWTLTNHGYIDYTKNLVTMLRTRGFPWTLCVVCADEASYNAMVADKIPAILVPTNFPDLGPNLAVWDSPQFHAINFFKMQMVHLFSRSPMVQKGIYLDGDVVIYQDFVSDVEDHLEECGLLFQCDEGSTNTTCIKDPCPLVCCGFIAWKHGHTGTLFETPDATVLARYKNDQYLVNDRLRTANLRYGTLPRLLYPNGKFIELLAEKKECYILHYNYIVGHKKRETMQRYGDWVLKEESSQ